MIVVHISLEDERFTGPFPCKTMRVNLQSPQPDTIERAAQVIRAGGIILYPTDTVYGLGCDPFNMQAVGRLFEIKQRPESKGVSLLIGDRRWVQELCHSVPPLFDRLAEEFWPGPVTFLFAAASRLSPLIQGDENKVGVRFPNCPFLERWMKTIPGPVVSSSANLSGQSPSSSVSELQALFGDQVNLFLETGDLETVSPSTVVDLSVDPPRLVRQGQLGEKVGAFLCESKASN